MEKEIAIKKISERFLIPEEQIIELLSGLIAPKKSKTKVDTEIKKPVFMKLVKESHDHNNPKQKYFFTEKDYALFLETINKIMEEDKRLGGELGDSCSESETFHDNFSFEEGTRQQKMWREHIEKQNKIRENSKIIKISQDKSVVSIGCEVIIEKSDGEIIKKVIGSYLTFSEDEISYKTALAKILIGKKIGDVVSGKINNELATFTIKEIN
jgi:transcription elongation GreA/GreB family factor